MCIMGWFRRERTDREIVPLLRSIVDQQLIHARELRFTRTTIKTVLETLNRNLVLQGEKIMATNEETAAKLDDLIETAKKIKGETAASLATIEELKAMVAAGNTTPEVLTAKIDELAGHLKAADDLVADVPAPSPEEPTA